jgi:DNA replication protein DnaC
LRLGGVPPTYIDAIWSRCPQREQLGRYCSGLVSHVRSGAGLLLLGSVGTGKSSAAALVATEAARRGYTVAWAYVADLLTALRDTTNRHRAIEVQQQHCDADLVIWDDFGVTDLTVWAAGALDQIAERRYSRRRPLVVTSNLTTDVLLTEQSYARMVSRWRERNKVLFFEKPMRGTGGVVADAATAVML